MTTFVKKTIVVLVLFLWIGDMCAYADDGPEFPWLFPSPCGLESVECDSGTLETDLEAALAALIICKHNNKQTCTTEEGIHIHSDPVCVAEGKKVVEVALAANTYLQTLSPEQREWEGRLADHLSYALGGSPESYPLSDDLLKEMGYIK